MDSSRIIDRWIADGGVPDTDVELRLLRRMPSLAAGFDDRIKDPIQRALLGLEEPPEMAGDLRQRLRIATARMDGSLSISGPVASDLEREAQASGDAHLWVVAARVNALSNVSRETTARMSLAAQDLPYVFPGEIHPLMVDVLACGERILPALHVDWVRKITSWLAPALVLDCRSLGLWFWPVLRFLEQGKLVRPLARLGGASNLPPGARGLATIYCHRLGISADILLSDGLAADERVAALGLLGDARNG